MGGFSSGGEDRDRDPAAILAVGATALVALPDPDPRLCVAPTPAATDDEPPPPIDFCAPVAPGRYRIPRFYALEHLDPAPGCVTELSEGAPLHQRCAFAGELLARTKQAMVADRIAASWAREDPRHHGAVVTLPCGFGKTVIALNAVARAGRRALVVVPSSILATQWIERCATFLPGARTHVLRGSVAKTRDDRWLVPGRTAADLERALEVFALRTFDPLDRPRRVGCKGLLRAELVDPPRGATLEVGDGWYRLGPTAAPVAVRVARTSAAPWVAAADTPAGAEVRFAAARTGAKLQEMAGVCPVPGCLLADSDLDVVVTTVQTLALAPPPPQSLEPFGTLVLDEVHSMCARKFSAAMQRAPCKYILALSATPERKDGMHVALPWLCGREVVRLSRTWERVGVRVHKYVGDPGAGPITLPSGKLLLARMVTRLCRDALRTRCIAELVAECADGGRRTLVLTERVDHMQAIAAAYLRLRPGAPCGMLCGDTPAADRDRESAQPTLCATYPMCRQGFDQPRLDTLIMATPVTAIEQCVGRILRAHPDKQVPLVLDIVDPYSIFAGEARKRMRQYTEWQYEVEHSADLAGAAIS
jgi:superfamily II DNA or RNA helicase